MVWWVFWGGEWVRSCVLGGLSELQHHRGKAVNWY